MNGVGDVGNIPETLALGAAAQAHGRALSEDLSAQLFAALDPSVYTTLQDEVPDPEAALEFIDLELQTLPGQLTDLQTSRHQVAASGS